jgi:hypothetical protein
LECMKVGKSKGKSKNSKVKSSAKPLPLLFSAVKLVWLRLERANGE